MIVALHKHLRARMARNHIGIHCFQVISFSILAIERSEQPLDGLGYIKDPILAPNFSVAGVFPQLHCLVRNLHSILSYELYSWF
jgi:hypothetical protein